MRPTTLSRHTCGYDGPSTGLARVIRPGSCASAPGCRAASRAITGPGPGWLLSGLRAWWPLLLLAVVAFAVRWPNLWYIPQFTDEVFDAQVAYGIWEGKRPLTGVNAYTGALFYYLLAGVFWIFGPSIYTPRLFVLILGVLAVVATGLLGGDLGRRAAIRSARPNWRRQLAGSAHWSAAACWRPLACTS